MASWEIRLEERRGGPGEKAVKCILLFLTNEPCERSVVNGNVECKKVQAQTTMKDLWRTLLVLDMMCDGGWSERPPAILNNEFD